MHRPEQYYIHTPLLRYLGVTPPISISDSNEREKEVTASLMDELRRQKTIESEEETRTRYLCILQHIHDFLRHPSLVQLGLSSFLPRFYRLRPDA
jgi:poly(A) polymerase